MVLATLRWRALGCIVLCGLWSGGSRAAAQNFSLNGQVRYYSDGTPVSGVTVELQGPAPASVQTDAAGTFSFTGLSQANWRVEPRKLGDLGTAISPLDARSEEHTSELQSR